MRITAQSALNQLHFQLSLNSFLSNWDANITARSVRRANLCRKTLSVFLNLCWNLWHQFVRSYRKKRPSVLFSHSALFCLLRFYPKPLAIYSSPNSCFFSLWLKKKKKKRSGQEFLALEVCLVTQRTREEPCVAFNSLHCLPEANLGRAQSLSLRSLLNGRVKS